MVAGMHEEDEAMNIKNLQRKTDDQIICITLRYNRWKGDFSEPPFRERFIQKLIEKNSIFH